MDSLLKEIKQISNELSSTEEKRNHLLYVKYVIENYILQDIMPQKVKINPKHELKIIQILHLCMVYYRNKEKRL